MNAICNHLFERLSVQTPDEVAKLSSQESVAGVTEILLSRAGESLKLVASMLAHLSSEQDGRWFTWVNPPSIGKQALKKSGFELSGFRSLKFSTSQSQKRQAFEFLLEALRLGNSRTIVTSLDGITQRQIQLLEQAASIGNTRCVVLRPR